MSIEHFSKEQFENALPVGHWEYTGLIQGEHTYSIKITDDIFISIRSSVDSSGYSADTGEDSIRAWLITKNGDVLGSKVSKWTNRRPGWNKRLLEVLRTLWKMAQFSGYCEKCKVPNGVYKIKKVGPNKGKIFKKCIKCGEGFEFMEDK